MSDSTALQVLIFRSGLLCGHNGASIPSIIPRLTIWSLSNRIVSGIHIISVCSVLELIEQNQAYLNQNPKGEPQLGRRGLYGSLGGNAQDKAQEMAMLWVLNLSDGMHTLLDIAETASLDFKTVSLAATSLKEHGLLKAVSPVESKSQNGRFGR